MFGYDRIRRLLGGDDTPPRFLIHRRRLILALCLRDDQHQRINADPPEVWLGSRKDHLEWGERLAMDTGAVWLFVSNGPNAQFRERGIYEILDSTNDPVELAKRMILPGVAGLSRIIFLKRQPLVAANEKPDLNLDSKS